MGERAGQSPCPYEHCLALSQFTYTKDSTADENRQSGSHRRKTCSNMRSSEMHNTCRNVQRIPLVHLFVVKKT